MLDALQIARMHDTADAHWHDASLPAPVAPNALAQLILEQHHANFDLWHREDEARNPLAADEVIAEVKHDIDRLNQRRNDLAERVDLALIEEAAAQNDDAPLHSETPGMMVDRMSILALKIFHTQEEVHRGGVEEAHHERNRRRLAVLREQRDDLARCLDELWSDVMAKRRRFKLYRQLKMYNDPDLNPVLYTQQETKAAAS